MRDFHRNYIYQATGTEKKSHKVKSHHDGETVCKCFVPFVKLHHNDCPMAKKTCPVHGSTLQGCKEKTEKGSEQCMIISFHPSSKTDRLFQPIKSLLARSPDTKVNLQYYTPKESSRKEPPKHCQIQTSFEDLKKSFGNNFFVEKTKSFVADKTNRMKKLKQCFYSPCSSIVQKSRSQISVKEKNNETFREDSQKKQNLSSEEKMREIGVSDDRASESSLRWVCCNKLETGDWKKLSGENLDSDFVTVTQKDKNNIINHKIYEIKYRKGVNTTDGSNKNPQNFIYASFENTPLSREKHKSTVRLVKSQQRNHSSDEQDSIEDKEFTNNGHAKKKEESTEEFSSSDKSHSDTSSSVYFTPFILMPTRPDETDSDTGTAPIRVVDKADQAVQVEDLPQDKMIETALVEYTPRTYSAAKRNSSVTNERPGAFEQETQTSFSDGTKSFTLIKPENTNSVEEVVSTYFDPSIATRQTRGTSTIEIVPVQSTAPNYRGTEKRTQATSTTPNEIVLLEDSMPSYDAQDRKLVQEKPKQSTVRQSTQATSTTPNEIVLLENTMTSYDGRERKSVQEKQKQSVEQRVQATSTVPNEVVLMEDAMTSYNAPDVKSTPEMQKQSGPQQKTQGTSTNPIEIAPSERTTPSYDGPERRFESERPTLRMAYKNPNDDCQVDFKSVVLEIVRNARSSEVLARRDRFTQTPRNVVTQTTFDTQGSVKFGSALDDGPSIEIIEIYNRKEQTVEITPGSQTRNSTSTSQGIFSRRQMKDGVCQTEQRTFQNVHVETVELKSEPQMTNVVQSSKAVKASYKSVRKQETLSVCKTYADTEYYGLNSTDPSRDTYVVKTFQSSECEHIMWGKSHSDSDLYDSRKCDCTETLSSIRTHPIWESIDSSRDTNPPKTDYSTFDSNKADNGSTTPAEISECFDKTFNEEIYSKEEDNCSRVSDLSEVTRMIDKIFARMGEEQLKFCDCQTTSRRESKAGVDRGTMTETAQQQKQPKKELVSISVQTPFNVILDQSADDKSIILQQNTSTVKVRRCVQLDEKSQSKSIFICTLCAREINTYTVNVGTSTCNFFVEKDAKTAVDKPLNEQIQIKTIKKFQNPVTPAETRPTTPRPIKRAEKGKQEVGTSPRISKQSQPSPKSAETKKLPSIKINLPIPSPRRNISFKKDSQDSKSIERRRNDSDTQKGKPVNPQAKPRTANTKVDQKNHENPSADKTQKITETLQIECFCRSVKSPSVSTSQATNIPPSPKSPPVTQRPGGSKDSTKTTGRPQPRKKQQPGSSGFIYPVILSARELMNLKLSKKLQSQHSSNSSNKSIANQKRSREKEIDDTSYGKKIKCDELGEINVLDFCQENFDDWSNEGSRPQSGNTGLKFLKGRSVSTLKKKSAGTKKDGEFAGVPSSTSQIPIFKKYLTPQIKLVKSEETAKDLKAKQILSWPKKEATGSLFTVKSLHHGSSSEMPLRKLLKCRVCKSTFFQRNFSDQHESKSSVSTRWPIRDENQAEEEDSGLLGHEQKSWILIPSKDVELLQDCSQELDYVPSDENFSRDDDYTPEIDNSTAEVFISREDANRQSSEESLSCSNSIRLDCDASADPLLSEVATTSKSFRTFWFDSQAERKIMAKKLSKGTNFQSRVFQVLRKKSAAEVNEEKEEEEEEY